jgi:two-component system CheB/CheR fusion protein
MAKKEKGRRNRARAAATAAQRKSCRPDAGQTPEPARRSFPVVGIGASAGGLEAFTQLLQALPPDTGMAFVLVLHLDPKHESMLAPILSRVTSMPVKEVEDGMVVEPNHIYVIPRDKSMAISHGVLRLLPRTEMRGLHLPIDSFFQSLARDLGNKAIGVILSGSASDGVLGTKAIKAEGGITFAQDEKSAKFDSMPRTAAAAGGIDFILPPEKIAAQLARIARYAEFTGHTAADVEETIPVNGQVFAEILGLLRRATGVDFTYYKHSTLKRRILRRMLLHGIRKLDTYIAHLREHPAELDALSQDILIHVTGFFRDPEAFRALQETVCPSLLKDRPHGLPIRVWVPGCSTGEEVYSIAITLIEYLKKMQSSTPVQIFATDISDQAIERARSAVYMGGVTADVSPERLQRFFVRLENGAYQVGKEIRDVCIFAKQDLTKDPPFSNLDLISCRNVLIYLGPPLQKKVIRFLHYALKPSGFLMLGSTETISGYHELFALVDQKNKIYAKKLLPGAPRLELFSREDFTGVAAAEKAKQDPAQPLIDLQKEVDRVLLAKYAPAGFLINDNLDILQFRGRTSDYLEPAPGQASLNLAKMAREGLIGELRAAISKARKEQITVKKEHVLVRQDGRSQEVTLEVIPLSAAGRHYFLVVFRDARTVEQTRSSGKSEGRDRGGTNARELARLRQELAATKEYLQSVIEAQETSNEELRSAYEELQSSNEELQSTNEELETAKEELQSANEELTTVNEALQSKNAELGRVNDDLNNLLASSNIPIVMLDSDLRIRRFTPMAEKVLNLIPGDVGRPIGNIKPNIDVPDLEALLRDVMENLHIQEREVQDQEGRWYSLRIRPYRTADNKIGGVVMTLLDIHALKLSVEQLRASRDYAEAIVDTVRQPLLVLDADLRVKRANRSFYRFFQVTPAETEERFFYDLGSGQFNIPRLLELLREIISKDSRCDDFELDREFDRIGRKILLLSARRLEAEGHQQQILIAIEDVTQQRLAAEMRFRRIFETAKDGIIIADAGSGEITDVNPYLESLLGYSRQELIGQKFADLLAPESVDSWREAIRALTEREHIRLDGLRVNCKEGRKLNVECVCSAHAEGGRQIIQCNLRDVSARKEAEERIRAALREKEVLLKEIHHRVKNNLQVIYSLLNLQARQVKDKNLLDLYKESQNRVKSMALIHEELYQSKDLANIDFGGYLRKLAISLLRNYGDPGRIRLDIDVADVLLGIDAAIPCGLIVNELVSNSLKYAFPEGGRGRIYISFRPQGPGAYQLIVGDDGIGLPPGFDLQKSESLGLQLVKTLSDQLGADLEVRTEHGTEFRITFREMMNAKKD